MIFLSLRSFNFPCWTAAAASFTSKSKAVWEEVVSVGTCCQWICCLALFADTQNKKKAAERQRKKGISVRTGRKKWISLHWWPVTRSRSWKCSFYFFNNRGAVEMEIPFPWAFYLSLQRKTTYHSHTNCRHKPNLTTYANLYSCPCHQGENSHFFPPLSHLVQHPFYVAAENSKNKNPEGSPSVVACCFLNSNVTQSSPVICNFFIRRHKKEGSKEKKRKKMENPLQGCLSLWFQN